MSSVDAVVITKNDGNARLLYRVINACRRVRPAAHLQYGRSATGYAKPILSTVGTGGNERTLSIPSEHIIVIEGPPAARSLALMVGRSLTSEATNSVAPKALVYSRAF